MGRKYLFFHFYYMILHRIAKDHGGIMGSNEDKFKYSI